MTFAEPNHRSTLKNKTFFKSSGKNRTGQPFFQAKLNVGPANDQYEREADTTADKVMRMSNGEEEMVRPKISPLKVQRKCAECEEEERENRAQRKAKPGETGEAPGEIHQAIDSRGQPMDEGTRSFMESRFGHDFSNVKVHTNDVAAKSAESVNALAYTSGNDIVFNKGQYSPGTESGKRLLAHELAHVVQQQSGVVANKIQRRVTPRLVRCTAGVASAPVNPVTVLTAIDARAMDMTTQISNSLNIDATTALHGIPATPSVTFQSYMTNFGLPNAVGTHFMNRLTGSLVASREIAMSQELHILARRFAMIAHLFSQFINYVCADVGQTRHFGGCSNGDCNEGDSWSCGGIGVIFLCPTFWSDYNNEQRASILIHESTHILWDTTDPPEEGHGTLHGAGKNFIIAGCYEQMVPDFFGFESAAECPAP